MKKIYQRILTVNQRHGNNTVDDIIESKKIMIKWNSLFFLNVLIII